MRSHESVRSQDGSKGHQSQLDGFIKIQHYTGEKNHNVEYRSPGSQPKVLLILCDNFIDGYISLIKKYLSFQNLIS